MRWRLLALCAAAIAAAACGSAASVAGPLETAVMEGPSLTGTNASLAFQRIRRAGASSVRLTLEWASVTPGVRPAQFKPADPLEPAYDWSRFDALLRQAAGAGLKPIVTVVGAPAWAEAPGGGRPLPAELGAFARAAAERYSGRHAGLPRVRHWMAWNEPNVSSFLRPQFAADGRPVSPGWYRQMLNRFAAGVRAARADNVVIAGGLAPFTLSDRTRVHTIGPLRFMRELLCLSAGPSPRPTCRTRVSFDIWSHHPYTSGGPTRMASHRDDVSLGDLPEMRALLDAAIRAGHVDSRTRNVPFWVTEFSWDTKPPDPNGVPAQLHTRWVAEAMYRMWKAGVSLVTWYLLRDQPYPSSPYQSGLYFRGATLERDRPKPALQAFRFPFVAFREGPRTFVWGRTPAGRPGTVAIEQRTPTGSWRRVAAVRTDRYGIFTARLPRRLTAGDWLRAREARPRGTNAVPFSLRVPRDRFFRPFG